MKKITIINTAPIKTSAAPLDFFTELPTEIIAVWLNKFNAVSKNIGISDASLLDCSL